MSIKRCSNPASFTAALYCPPSTSHDVIAHQFRECIMKLTLHGRAKCNTMRSQRGGSHNTEPALRTDALNDGTKKLLCTTTMTRHTRWEAGHRQWPRCGGGRGCGRKRRSVGRWIARDGKYRLQWREGAIPKQHVLLNDELHVTRPGCTAELTLHSSEQIHNATTSTLATCTCPAHPGL